MPKKGGVFITLEGIDGAGKTTHLSAIQGWCAGRGYEVVVTREPGGTALGESLRSLILHHEMDAYTESLLLFAARREHVVQVIQPALSRGCCVISDRFLHASYAYQGGGRGLPFACIQSLCQDTCGDLMPDLTFFFDLPIDQQAARLRDAQKDRFELSASSFFQRVRDTYLRFTQTSHFYVLSADLDRTVIDAQIKTSLQHFFDND